MADDLSIPFWETFERAHDANISPMVSILDVRFIVTATSSRLWAHDTTTFSTPIICDEYTCLRLSRFQPASGSCVARLLHSFRFSELCSQLSFRWWSSAFIHFTTAQPAGRTTQPIVPKPNNATHDRIVLSLFVLSTTDIVRSLTILFTPLSSGCARTYPQAIPQH